MESQKDKPGDTQNVAPVIRYVQAEEITIYSVRSDQLEKLATGGSESIYLNVSLALLSFSAGLVIAILTMSKTSVWLYATLFSGMLVTGILGLVFLGLWYRTHVSTKTLLADIKAGMRLPIEQLPSDRPQRQKSKPRA